MSKKLQAQTRLALQVAVNLLDKYFSAGEDPIWEEDIITGRVVEAIPALQGFPSFDLLKDWTFTYNATYVPSCCAGECVEFDLQPVGHIDIFTGKNHHSFSLELLLCYEWDI